MPGIDKLLDAAGRFGSEDIPRRLDKQAVGFVGFVEKLRGKRLRRIV
jgi:hypothetical protein